MKPVAATDLLPRPIEVRRSRRRSVELSLEHGKLVARVPLRIAAKTLEALLAGLRRDMWESLQRRYVFDDTALQTRAAAVAQEHLSDLRLPPYTAHFSRRQRKRWGSCGVGPTGGKIRISAALIGHPLWVLDQVLLHELIHLHVQDHGPRFQELMRRGPHRERAHGYLEALENTERFGPEMLDRLAATVEVDVGETEEGKASLPLFDTQSEPPSARTANDSLDSGA